MKHLSQSQLILHYYGEAEEDGTVAAHLAVCPLCLESYQALERVLASMESLEAPEPAENYEAA
ncbi:MAG: hypothetical protein ACLQVN_16485, partial [Bryobacteraceae bacterium]